MRNWRVTRLVFGSTVISPDFAPPRRLKGPRRRGKLPPKDP
jgi:hypothetical protein